MTKRRLFVTGDVHGWHDICKLNKDKFLVGNTLCKDDILIICGDAGIIWDGTVNDEEKILWYEQRPWTTIYCDGNHENFDLLSTYPIVDFHGAKAHKLGDSVYHILRGEIMELEDGRTFLFFGGAFSHDYQYRTKNVNWFEEELPVQGEIDNCISNLQKYDYKVDYCITHDLPTRFCMQMGYYNMNFSMMQNYSRQYINIHAVLDNIYEMTTFKTWFAGHYHEDKKMYGKSPVQVLMDNIVEINS